MATNLATPAPRARPTDVVWSDRVLSAAAVVLLLATLIAVARGAREWGLVPTTVWVHLATVLTAVVLTPVMLLRPRGDRLHRRLGYVWVTAMFATAAISFNIRMIFDGSLSYIHILSAWTMIQVPVIVLSARSHKIARHRRAVRGMVIGALLVAGFFTFGFNRLLAQWLFGGAGA